MYKELLTLLPVAHSFILNSGQAIYNIGVFCSAKICTVKERQTLWSEDKLDIF